MEIDFLLEDEKRKMEQSVLNSFNLKPQGRTEENEKDEIEEKKTTIILDNTLTDKDIEKAVSVDPKKKKKFELVDDFMKLQEERGDIKIDRKKLERMTKGAIIKEMAEYVNEVILPTSRANLRENAEGEHIPEYTTQGVSTAPTVEGELNPHQLELVSHGLFQMNQVLVSLLETGSAYAKDKTGGIAVLENWSQKTLEKKQQFLDVFKLIYKDYKVELDKYLSPVVQYSILMGNSAAEVIVANIKKKKEQSQQK